MVEIGAGSSGDRVKVRDYVNEQEGGTRRDSFGFGLEAPIKI